jgi:hypothetical protein
LEPDVTAAIDKGKSDTLIMSLIVAGFDSLANRIKNRRLERRGWNLPWTGAGPNLGPKWALNRLDLVAGAGFEPAAFRL